ncbi:hypothetical protein AOT82_264 [Psychrobacter sp. AntiMn-1]|nr:hypothetical protein AOT82_264 [Psychrobacter sp. AntiMn-1]
MSIGIDNIIQFKQITMISKAYIIEIKALISLYIFKGF